MKAAAEKVYVLKTRNRMNTLNNFVFQNKEHADAWMAQVNVKAEGYRVEVWWARRRKRTSLDGWILLKRLTSPAEQAQEGSKS